MVRRAGRVALHSSPPPRRSPEPPPSSAGGAPPLVVPFGALLGRGGLGCCWARAGTLSEQPEWTARPPDAPTQCSLCPPRRTPPDLGQARPVHQRCCCCCCCCCCCWWPRPPPLPNPFDCCCTEFDFQTGSFSLGLLVLPWHPNLLVRRVKVFYFFYFSIFFFYPCNQFPASRSGSPYTWPRFDNLKCAHNPSLAINRPSQFRRWANLAKRISPALLLHLAPCDPATCNLQPDSCFFPASPDIDRPTGNIEPCRPFRLLFSRELQSFSF